MAVNRNKARLEHKVHNKWRHFERLVAAIHQAADQGAEVRWNETIDGRQFDVTIRFRRGLYDHLTVVECKDYKQSVSIEKVEAFVTKSRDIHANVAVLASTSGFQSGAKEAARRHGITLLHVSHRTSVNLSLLGLRWGEPTEMLHIERVLLLYADGTKKGLPDESNVLTYYCQHTLLERAGQKSTLDSVIAKELIALPLKQEYHVHTIDVEDGTHVVAPDDGEIPLKELSSIQIRTALVEGKTFTGPYKIDPAILSHTVDVQNIGSGETTSFDFHSLPLGVGTRFVAGKFYEAAGLGFFHFCRSVTNDSAEVWLVESFQHGHLLQAQMILEMKAAEKYIEVTDQSVIERLERRRKRMEASSPA